MTYTAGQRVLASGLNNNTLQLLQSVKLTGTSASVELDVPATVTVNHLMVKWHARCDGAVATTGMQLQLNGNTANAYLNQKAEANNTTQSDAIALQTFINIGAIPGASAVANYFGAGDFSINGNSDTANFIPVIGTATCFSASNNGFVGVYGGMLAVTGAITKVVLTPGSGNFVAQSAFSLLACA